MPACSNDETLTAQFDARYAALKAHHRDRHRDREGETDSKGGQDPRPGFVGLLRRDTNTGGWICPKRYIMCLPGPEQAWDGILVGTSGVLRRVQGYVQGVGGENRVCRQQPILICC